MNRVFTFVGGYKYRFIKSSGVHFDYVQAGGNGADTLWRDDAGNLQNGSDVLRDVVEIREIWRPD
jgi:hypothetical protein